MIHGNTLGLRESVLREMEKLYDISFDRSFFLPDRLLGLLVGFTEQLNREIMVYLDRNGEILEVAVGSISQVGLTEMHLRRDLDRLTGFRCIHTHPGGNARLSEVDLQALRLLRFDAMCAVGVENGLCTPNVDIRVQVLGGTLLVRCGDDGVTLTGEASMVYEAETGY